MKFPALVAVVATCACAWLAACSGSAPTTAALTPSPKASHSVVLVNCPQEYQTWLQGPAKAFVPAIRAVDSSAVSRPSAQNSALKNAGPAIRSAAKYPIPACADPKGYWIALVMHINAAEAGGGSSLGSPSVTLDLRGIPELERELTAELKLTVDAR